MTSMLFSGFQMSGLYLRNRITMTPMYLGYASPDGTVNQLLLDHYSEMAASGAAMIVVEHTAVHSTGLGSPFMLRVDDDRYIPGLSRLAEAIKKERALAFLQINHTGRYAFGKERLAPSSFPTGEVIPKEMTLTEIDSVAEAFGTAARRVKEAGFDGVEIHGGMGYLLVQFLSPRTNHRTDHYGGNLDNRMRFPLRVVDSVFEAVGKDFPVGYRFMADEEDPAGLHPDESTVYARELQKRVLSYLSVVSGTHDAYRSPGFMEKMRTDAYMAQWAAIIKQAVPDMPIITAGRIQSPEIAEKLLTENVADLIGLARVLWADPLWPKKAAGLAPEPIVRCEPMCSLCHKRLSKGKPAYCSQWTKIRRQEFLAKLGEQVEESE